MIVIYSSLRASTEDVTTLKATERAAEQGFTPDV